jgi:hypothetical protein
MFFFPTSSPFLFVFQEVVLTTTIVNMNCRIHHTPSTCPTSRPRMRGRAVRSTYLFIVIDGDGDRSSAARFICRVMEVSYIRMPQGLGRGETLGRIKHQKFLQEICSVFGRLWEDGAHVFSLRPATCALRQVLQRRC